MHRKTSFFHIGILGASRTVFQICILFAGQVSSAQVTPIKNAHSHNDYRQEHPLEDALKNRFISVEADVFLINGELIVAHSYPVFKKRTLEDLYLKPLQKIWLERNHEIYKEEALILLIDIKSDVDKVYPVLKALMEKYSSMLSGCNGHIVRQRAVTVIISGKTSQELIEKDEHHLIFLDQSLFNLTDKMMPATGLMASTRYSNITKWKGKGEMPEKEKEKLKELVKAAHAQGKIVRLWASPENEKVWTELLNCGVDLINTDNLEKLSIFFKKRK